MSAYQILSVFVLLIFSATGQISPVCFAKSSKYSKPPKLPSLPDAFTATIEANILNKKYSIEITEFYNKKTNFGAMRSTRNGQKTHRIWDYNHDEVIRINENERSCLVGHISSYGRRTAFGPCMPTGNGSCAHIEGVADLFRFGAKYNETYMGEKWIRGIRCNHWQTCINHHHSSYTLDYYFSVSKWNSTFGYPETVVRAEINGTGKNHKRGPSGHFSFTNETHDFQHVYDFFSFIPGPPEPKSFQVPRGLYCKGMISTKQIPDVPYKVFTMELEWTFPRSNMTSSNSVFHLKEMYDSRRNLVQLELDPRKHTQNTSTTAIYDFNTDIVYTINQKTQVCHSFMMTDKKYSWQMLGYNDSHHIRLKNTMDLFFRKDKTKTLIYTGSANVRGIDADVWVEKFNDTWTSRYRNRTYKFTEIREVYFSKPSWNMKSWSLPTQHQVPVRLDVYVDSSYCKHPVPGRPCHWVMNVFNFNSNPQLPIGAFDIRRCFKPEQRTVVHFSLIEELKFPYFEHLGDYKKHAQRDRLPILYAVTDTIATTANVSFIRISSVEIFHVDNDEQLIGIKLYLLEKPNMAGVSFPVPEKSLKDAVLAVKNAVENGKLSISFLSGAESNMTSMTAKRSSYYEGASDVIFVHGPGRKKSKGVSGGAVAAIALFTLVVGLLIGLGVAHWQAKKKGISLFAYQRQNK